MIAIPTLDAIRALLRAQAAERSRRRSTTPTLKIRLDEHPPLTEVGGVARIERGAEGDVAVARIGRTSFVAYRLDEAGLRQLRVDLDVAAGTLSVEPDSGP
jgi:hypothetical protein